MDGPNHMGEPVAASGADCLNTTCIAFPYMAQSGHDSAYGKR